LHLLKLSWKYIVRQSKVAALKKSPYLLSASQAFPPAQLLEEEQVLRHALLLLLRARFPCRNTLAIGTAKNAMNSLLLQLRLFHLPLQQTLDPISS